MQIEIRVGEPIHPSDKKKVWSYSHCEYKDGWADASKYKPLKYDLVMLLYGKRQIPGWWTGNDWAGRKVPTNSEPTAWNKRMMNYD